MWTWRKKRAPEPVILTAPPDDEPVESAERKHRREMQKLAEQDAARGQYETRGGAA